MDNEPGISEDYLPMDPKRLLERLHTALNTRDVENLVRCFQVDYESFFPAEPERDYIGQERLRSEWEEVFAVIPDFQADLLHHTVDGPTIWSEWHWRAGEELVQAGREGLNQAGVIIFGVEDGLIAWGRFYMLDVQPAGEGGSATGRAASGAAGQGR